MARLEIHQFPCLSDNYGVLIHDSQTGIAAAIDAPDAAKVKAAIADTGWRLTHIFTTHHHRDHTDGNLPSSRRPAPPLSGPRARPRRFRASIVR